MHTIQAYKRIRSISLQYLFIYYLSRFSRLLACTKEKHKASVDIGTVGLRLDPFDRIALTSSHSCCCRCLQDDVTVISTRCQLITFCRATAPRYGLYFFLVYRIARSNTCRRLSVWRL